MTEVFRFLCPQRSSPTPVASRGHPTAQEMEPGLALYRVEFLEFREHVDIPVAAPDCLFA